MDLFLVWLFIIAQVVISLVYCFWGYRYFRVIIAFYAFIFVFPLMYSMLAGSMSQPVAILISLAVAAVAALLAWFIYRLGIFLAGGLAGIMIARFIYNMLGSSYQTLSIILGIILFILLGVLALKFQKAIIILVSSISGGFNLVIYGLFIAMNASLISSFSILKLNEITSTISSTYQAESTWIIPSIILAVAGIFVQALVTAKGKE
jgi:hypothetical protein